MSAGALHNIGDPRAKAPQEVFIGNGEPNKVPVGMLLAPPVNPDSILPEKTDKVFLDLDRREYSEFRLNISVNCTLMVTNAVVGSRFRLFTISETNSVILSIPEGENITVRGADNKTGVPYTAIYEFEVLHPEENNGIRYRCINLIIDDNTSLFTTWSSYYINEKLTAINTELADGLSSMSETVNADIVEMQNIFNALQYEISSRKISYYTEYPFGDTSVIEEFSIAVTYQEIIQGEEPRAATAETLTFAQDGYWKFSTDVYANDKKLSTVEYVDSVISNIQSLMSTDSERINAISALALAYQDADQSLNDTITAALVTKASRGSETILGYWTFAQTAHFNKDIEIEGFLFVEMDVQFYQSLIVYGDCVIDGTCEAERYDVYSDSRLKSNQQVIQNALSILTELEGCTYIINGKQSAGVIAQKTKEVYPVAVHGQETESTYLSVNYNTLIPLLIEGVKELKNLLNV